MYNPLLLKYPWKYSYYVCRMKTSSCFPSKANENKFTYVAYSKAVLDDSLAVDTNWINTDYSSG